MTAVQIEEQVSRALKESLKSYCDELVEKNLAVSTLIDPKIKSTQLQEEIWQEIATYKKLCVDGCKACVAEVRLLSRSDPSIDIQAFEDNLSKALQRLQTSSSVHKCAKEVVSGRTWMDLLSLTETTMQLLYIGAQVLFNSKRYSEAEAAFCFLSTIDSMQYAFWAGLGHARYHQQNFPRAIAAYQMAMLCDPFAIWPYFFSANAFEAESDWEQARLMLEDAKSLYEEQGLQDKELYQAIIERLQRIHERE